MELTKKERLAFIYQLRILERGFGTGPFDLWMTRIPAKCAIRTRPEQFGFKKESDLCDQGKRFERRQLPQ